MVFWKLRHLFSEDRRMRTEEQAWLQGRELLKSPFCDVREQERNQARSFAINYEQFNSREPGRKTLAVEE